MFTDSIYFRDRSSASNQRAIELLNIAQSQSTQKRKFHQRGSTSRQQNDYQSFCSASAQKLERRFASTQTLFIWCWVPAYKIANAHVSFFRRCRSGSDPRDVDSRRKHCDQTAKHRVRGFAYLDDTEIGEFAKIVTARATTKYATGATDTIRDGSRNIQSFKRAKKNLPRE